MFIKHLFLIISMQIFFRKIKCEIIFQDQFNELNLTNWIVMDRKADCEKMNPRKMICDTSNEINLRTISGTLAITAINQAYFDRKFTSATIITKRAFKFDEHNYFFRIRAALTKAPGLLPHIFLILDQDYKRRIFTSFFTIISRSNNKLWNGNSLVEIDQTPMDNTNLDEFQDYDLILSKESRLIWRINNQVYLNSSSNRGLWGKVFNHSFRLGITLDLDSEYSEKQLDDWSMKLWNCSTFLIDSVQIEHDFESVDQEVSREYKDIHQLCENITQSEHEHSKISPGLISPLNLLWSDEFDQDTIAQHKWTIKTTQIECSDYNRVEEKGCYSSIDVSNGTLKLYPIKSQPGENDEVIFNATGIIIASIPYFKNVRVEIRAKRPKGVELYAKLYMQASPDDQSDLENVTGVFDIAHLRDSDEVSWSFTVRDHLEMYSRKSHKKIFHSERSDLFYTNNFFVSSINLTANLQHAYYYHTTIDLDEFQVYGIEWNDMGIQWLFNDQVIYQANPKMDQYGRPMTMDNINNENYFLPFKRPFNLLIKILASDYDEESDSPVFEIDYVRVYGNQLIGSEIIDLRNGEKQNANQTESIGTKSSMYALIGVSSVIFILLVILAISLMISILIIRKIKQKNQNMKKEIQEDYYDDIFMESEYNQFNCKDSEDYEDILYDKVDMQSISKENPYSDPTLPDENLDEYIEIVE